MLLTRIFSRSSQWCRMRSFTPRCTVDVRLQCIMGKPRFCVCRGLYWSLILIKIEAGHRNYCFRKVWKKSCIRIQTSVRTVNCITMNFEGCQSHGRIVVVFKLFKTIQGSYSLVFSRKVLKSASQFSRPGKCVQNKDDEVRENGLETVVDIA